MKLEKECQEALDEFLKRRANKIFGDGKPVKGFYTFEDWRDMNDKKKKRLLFFHKIHYIIFRFLKLFRIKYSYLRIIIGFPSGFKWL